VIYPIALRLHCADESVGLHPDEAVEHLSRVLLEQSEVPPQSQPPLQPTPSALSPSPAPSLSKPSAQQVPPPSSATDDVAPSAPTAASTTTTTTTTPPRPNPPKAIYIITSTTSASAHNHHNNNNTTSKDKISRAVRAFLNEHHYIWRDFTVASHSTSSTGPGAAGIIGVDPSSGDKTAHRPTAETLSPSPREGHKATEEAPSSEAGGATTKEEQNSDESATAVRNS
jgi:hypothetical protein